MKLLLDPNHGIIDLQGNLEVLEQKMEIIMELDGQLLDLMLEDETPAEDVDAETSRADEILGKYNGLKAKDRPPQRITKACTLAELNGGPMHLRPSGSLRGYERSPTLISP
ncbi:hypothetical protein JTB14_004760 [Gonioctena quinquepunctata]|nr:hypothetical protein JTB14_004760 [Gonioctena quinquepunctata]